MKIKLNTVPRQTSLGLWIHHPDGSWRCGNVMVRNCGGSDRYTQDWYVFVRNRGEWDVIMPDQRPWGYGHAGQAKIGAALMARYRSTGKITS